TSSSRCSVAGRICSRRARRAEPALAPAPRDRHNPASTQFGGGAMASAENERVMVSERVAPGMLPRVLRSVDMSIIFLAIVVFVFYGAAIFVIGLAGVLWLAGGNSSANSFSGASNWLPHASNWTFFGLVILALLGIEVPLNMGVEIVHTRSIKKYLFWGSLLVMIAYLWATFGNMVTVPLAENNSTTGVLSAVENGFFGAHWL